MRIGHYAPQLTVDGGAATYVRRLGEAQSEHGHDIIYLSTAPELTRIPQSNYHPTSDDQSLFREAKRLDVDLLHLHEAPFEIPSNRPPTVRTIHGHRAGCPSGSRYLKRSGRPCDRKYTITGCLWGHIVDRCGSVRPHKTVQNFTRIRREIKQASQIPTMTVSNFSREQMVRAGCPPENLYTFHSPSPETDIPFSPVSREDAPRFVFLGRLVPEKGLDWLLRAFTQVDVPAHLDIAGEGPKRDAMETLAKELEIAPEVSFHGWVEDKNIPSLIQQARAVVFPSVWHEPAGLVSLEAAAYGRPVIASRVGGIPEYARPEFATLVDVRNVDELTETITHFAQHPKRANEMGKRGYQIARSEYAIDDFIQTIDEWYASVLTKYSPR